MKFFVKYLFLLLSLLLLSNCSNLPKTDAPVVDIVDKSGSSTGTMTSHKPAASNPIVVAGLQKQARQLDRTGESAKAAAILERAIRIQPRNPGLWQQLAQVRFTQKKYHQAESLALRSNQYASRSPDIRRANWLLISSARAETGNSKGAREAREQADKLGSR